MSRWSGRLISKTPVTPGGAAPTATAPGVWTLPEVAYWNKQGRWPSAGADPYWSYVSYLLGTTATNAAQNNTFLDSSTNNFTITRNGNTTQGSFTPYGTLWSNYFDGSGDYLTSSGGTATAVGTGDFSVEAFVYWTSYPTQYTSIFSTRSTNNANAAAFTVGVESSGYVYAFSSAFIAQTSSGVFALNTWNHVVFTRSGTTARLFVNGVLRATGTNSQNFSDQGFAVAANRDGTEPGAGYVSNVRMVKGSIPADYQTSSTTTGTTIFTPPAAPLTAISGTSLLTCQSNRFIDNSSNAFAITKNGDTSVTAFSPFVLAPPGYDAQFNGGSGYFDGNGDYLQLADNAAFDLGAGDWTLETWANFTALPAVNGGMVFVSQWESSLGWIFYLYNNAGTYQLYLSYSTNGSNQINLGVNLASAPPVNAWSHIAFVRSGTNFLVFLNGVQVGATQTLNATIFNSTSTVNVGQATSTYYMQGYLSNLRLVKGTAVYTSAFTPPATPVTAISGTSLLLNFTNAGIFDAAMQSDMETVGNAQVSTTQAKFGTTSVYFDGSGDVITVPTNSGLSFGTGDFTVECWLYFTSYGSANQNILDFRGSAGTGNNITLYLENVGGTGTKQLRAYNGTGDAAATANNFPLNTWSHVAITRASNSFRFFVNGTQVGSTTTVSTNYVNTAGLYIGAYSGNVANFFGYLDDVRITNGYARYTGNFTPPATALPPY